MYKSTIANNSSVAVHIERGWLKTIEDNRAYVKVIIESILYLCQQGLPLRGHRETLDTNDSSVNVGNFRALVLLQNRNNEIVKHRRMNGPKMLRPRHTRTMPQRLDWRAAQSTAQL